MKEKCISRVVLAAGFASMLLLASPSEAKEFKAVFVGPHYPGGAAFDDTIAGTRMTDLSAAFGKWDNWKVQNINTLTGAVTAAAITTAITNANVGANDVFVFVYHGHGSYTRADLPNGNPVGDPEDETYALPPLNAPAGWMKDDALATALGALPQTSIKLVINLSCYGGGFWNDLQALNNVVFMSGSGETQELAEPPDFYNNMMKVADKANLAVYDTDNNQKISMREFYEGSKAAGAVFGNRWGDPLTPDFDSPRFIEYASQYNTNATWLDGEDLLVVPEPSTYAAVLTGLAGLAAARRRRA